MAMDKIDKNYSKINHTVKEMEKQIDQLMASKPANRSIDPSEMKAIQEKIGNA
jgi:oligoendopeptidase F